LKPRLLIWGGGGVAGHVLSIVTSGATAYPQIGFLLDDAPAGQHEVLGYPLLGTRQVLKQLDPALNHVFPAGSSPAVRREMAQYLHTLGFFSPTLIDPDARVRSSAQLGQGCLIEAFAFVDHRALLGDFVLLGNYASVAHDCQVGAFSSLYIGSRVLGHALLAEGCLLGANACLFPSRRMGRWSKASVLSAVDQDVPDFHLVSGNPARIIRAYGGPPPASLYPLPDMLD